MTRAETSSHPLPHQSAALRLAQRWVILIAVSLVLVFSGCATAPKSRITIETLPAEQQDRAQQNLAVFNRVWDLVNRRHFDPKFQGVDWEASAVKYGPRAIEAKDDEALYRILNQMLNELHDSHTQALAPQRAQERRTQQRARTGFNMSRIEGRWVVTDLLPESPAEKAGVKLGWIVVSRNGEPLGDRLNFRPNVGDEWQWEFLTGTDERVVLAPKAQQLSIGSRQVKQELEGGLVYLRFDSFAGPDRRWLSRELKQHAEAPGVVIDLRRNPGGDTFSLGTTIGEFFNRAVDCGTFISRDGRRDVQNSWQIGSANYRGKVAVLIDGASGSAAEIFSAVLQDHGRATLIGRTTAGAVLASWFYRLPGGGELQLSREDYVAPKGRRIEGNGVKPDIEVTRTLADWRTGRDADLETALRVLRGENVAR